MLQGGDILNGNGTGSISLFIAQKAKEVHGFEVIVSAIEDATRNAVQNGIGNAYFHVANLDNFFKFGVGKKYPKPEVIELTILLLFRRQRKCMLVFDTPSGTRILQYLCQRDAICSKLVFCFLLT